MKNFEIIKEQLEGNYIIKKVKPIVRKVLQWQMKSAGNTAVTAGSLMK